MHPYRSAMLDRSPTHLRRGHILALDKAARALWLERCIGTEAEYETVFAALCSRYDGTEWDCAQLRRALDAEVAERGECSIHESHLELESRLR